MKYDFRRYNLLEKQDNNIIAGYFSAGAFCGLAVNFVINQINIHTTNDELVPFMTIGAATIGLIGSIFCSEKRRWGYHRAHLELDKEAKKEIMETVNNLNSGDLDKINDILSDPKLLDLICDIRDLNLEETIREIEKDKLLERIDCTYEELTDSEKYDIQYDDFDITVVNEKTIIL